MNIQAQTTSVVGLNKWAQEASRDVQAWPRVHAKLRFEDGDVGGANGVTFLINGDEFGHIHLDGEVHPLLTAELSRQVVSKKFAKRFPWGDNAMVESVISDSESMKRGLWLLRLAYDLGRGLSTTELTAKIEQGL